LGYQTLFPNFKKKIKQLKLNQKQFKYNSKLKPMTFINQMIKYKNRLKD